MDMLGAMTRLEEEEELADRVMVSVRVVTRPVVEPGRVSVVTVGDSVTTTVVPERDTITVVLVSLPPGIVTVVTTTTLPDDADNDTGGGGGLGSVIVSVRVT